MPSIQNLSRRPSGLIGSFKLSKPDFYVVGGSLRSDSPSYVQRSADTELYENLVQGRFCFVLTPRQMGKSSLMIRTAGRLRERGIGVAVLDLTGIGQNLNAEQWYAGMLVQIGQQLDLEGELIDHWERHSQIGPLQRWVNALFEVVVANSGGRTVIFVDEIDVVRTLKFNTDEFFAGIREIYNRRAGDGRAEKLTFCLLGVATPADLTSDTRTTPFNIGHKVELNDFSPEEAVQLAQGLKRGKENNLALLRRVLYWTNGHPYLTQKICQTIAGDIRASAPGDVDRICRDLYLSAKASKSEDNLLFVRDRILRTEGDLGGLLALYARVRSRLRLRAVRFDGSNPLISRLQLSGITREEKGQLKVRNRIYARVFNRKWIAENLPEAERRRRRRAWITGFLLASAIAVPIITAMKWTIDLIRKQEATNLRLLYAARMNLAVQDWEKANITRMRTIFDSAESDQSFAGLKGFEWGYFRKLMNQDIATLDQEAPALGLAYSPDGKEIATSDVAGWVRIWDAGSGSLKSKFRSHNEPVWKVIYSPDGRYLIAAAQSREAKVWDLANRQPAGSLATHSNNVSSVDLSGDGSRLATGSWDSTIKIWTFPECSERMTLRGHRDYVWSAIFSPDGRRLASASEDRDVKIWDAATGRTIRTLTGHHSSVYTLAFSPDGGLLASAGNDGEIIIWETGTGRILRRFAAHRSSIFTLGFTSDGRYLFSGGEDRVIRFWNHATGVLVFERKGHSYEIGTVRISPSGDKFASSSRDGTVKIWASPWNSPSDILVHPGESVDDLCLSSSGRVLITANGEWIRTWDAGSGKMIREAKGPAKIKSLACSPDGRFIVTGHRDGMVAIRDAGSLEPAGQILPPFQQGDRVINTLAISGDGRWLVSGSRDHLIRIWDFSKAPDVREIRVLARHQRGVRQVAFSRDDRYLTSVGDDSLAVIWQTGSFRELTYWTNAGYQIYAAAFSPDGRLVATGGNDRIATVRDWRAGRVAARLIGHSSDLSTLTFSPDGRRLVTGGGLGTVKFWDIDTGLEIAAFTDHKGAITKAAFTGDGLVLATGSRDSTVRLWRSSAESR